MTFLEIVIIGACSMFHLTGDAAINPRAGIDYVACRWNYTQIAQDIGVPRKEVKKHLKNAFVTVRNRRTGDTATARVSDWGPAKWTGRHADLSPRLMRRLNLTTGDMVEIRVKLMKGKANGRME